MIQHVGGIPHGATAPELGMPRKALAGGSHVLLVGADLHWSRAVRLVAHDLGRIPVDAVPSGGHAVARLLNPRRPYSHVLLNPARDDGELLTILGLTCDEEASGSELLLLGRSCNAPSHVCTIPGPTHEAIRTALIEGCGPFQTDRPSVAELRTALAEKRIATRYQPLVHLRDRRPAGFETLARLVLANRRMIAPDRFVPQIEDAGLAAALTQLVAASCFADITAPGLAPFGFTVALNAPLDVLLMPEAMQSLDAARKAAGLAAPRVVIELTESRVVTDLAPLRRAVEQLRQAGYGVAIDDVGPAMPRHRALMDMPFSTVKIDKMAVMRGGIAADAAAFVRQIITAAKGRGQLVVVEGVGDVPTWNRVRDAGADLAQGFVIGRPMPAEVIPAWMKAWRARTDLG